MKVSYKKYSELLSRHQGYLYTIISKRVSNKSDLEDVLQMCNEKILLRYDLFDPSSCLKEEDLIGRFKGWIAAFSRNSVSAWFRIKKKSSKELVDDEVYAIASETIGEEDQEFVRKCDRERLEEINYKLYLHSRTLNDYEFEIFSKLKSGLNLREIGNDYGISHQAVQQLREKIFQKVKRSFSATDSVLKVSEIPNHLKVLENFFNPVSEVIRGKDRELKVRQIFSSKAIDKLLEKGWSINKISSHFSLGQKFISKYVKENDLLSSYQSKIRRSIIKKKDCFILSFSDHEIMMDNKFYNFINKFKSLIFKRGSSRNSDFSISLSSKSFKKLNNYLNKNFNLDLSSVKSKGFKSRGLTQLIYELNKSRLLERGQKVSLKENSSGKPLDLRPSNIKYFPRRKNFSKYHGVVYSINDKCWKVIFSHNKKNYKFSGFSSEKEAAKKYNEEIVALKGRNKSKKFLNDIK